MGSLVLLLPAQPQQVSALHPFSVTTGLKGNQVGTTNHFLTKHTSLQFTLLQASCAWPRAFSKTEKGSKQGQSSKRKWETRPSTYSFLSFYHLLSQDLVQVAPQGLWETRHHVLPRFSSSSLSLASLVL